MIHLSKVFQLTFLKQIIFLCAVGIEEGCPRTIQSKLLRAFTVDTFNNGRYDDVQGVSRYLHQVPIYLRTSRMYPEFYLV